MSASDLGDRPRLEVDQGSEKLRNQRQKVLQAVRSRTQHDDPERSAADSLLRWDALVGGDQDFEPACHRVQEVAVVQVTPAHFWSMPNIVADEVLPQPSGHTCVEEHSHTEDWLRLCGDCLLQQRRLGELEDGDCMFSRDARKVVEEGL